MQFNWHENRDVKKNEVSYFVTKPDKQPLADSKSNNHQEGGATSNAFRKMAPFTKQVL
jgi:hypothetical protein